MGPVKRSFHILFKPEYSLRKLPIFSVVCRFGIIRVRMKAIEKFNDVKSTSVDIEMDIALFKIRRYRFPNFDLRMQGFHCLPCRLPNSPAVDLRRHKQQIQHAPFPIYPEHNAADNGAFPVHNAVGLPPPGWTV